MCLNVCLTITRISVENIEILAISIILYLRIRSFSNTVLFVIIIVVIVLEQRRGYVHFVILKISRNFALKFHFGFE